MAKPHLAQEVGAPLLRTCSGDFELKETVRYVNGGSSYFYAMMELPKVEDETSLKIVQPDTSAKPDSVAVIIDDGICDAPVGGARFDYFLLTGKQNEYVAKYDKVLRFLSDDLGEIDGFLQDVDETNSSLSVSQRLGDRNDFADASPLERQLEEGFARVCGTDSVRYLWKEYGITDFHGSTRYLDYLIKTRTGDIAVEENGVSCHHPQIIGEERYRSQLLKQNSCVVGGIKLYRFSTEDCQFIERFEDDIRTYFGESTENFIESGLVVDRPFRLYEHQEVTLDEMAAPREVGA